MLQEYIQDGPHAGKPAGKLGEGVSLCFLCEDALALYREFTSRGVEASEPQVGNSMGSPTSLTQTVTAYFLKALPTRRRQ
jgi:hypothetical protein